MGAPGRADGADLLWPGHAGEAIALHDGAVDAEVADGEDVGPVELEDEEHFCGPPADAADACEVGDDLFIGPVVEAALFKVAGDEVLGEAVEGGDFLAGEPGCAELFGGRAEDLGGLGKWTPIAEVCAEAGEDGACGAARELLVDDGAAERFEVAGLGWARLDGAEGIDEGGHDRVGCPQMGDGAFDLEGHGGHGTRGGAQVIDSSAAGRMGVWNGFRSRGRRPS